MSKLRRYYITGNYYFITNVTYNREPFLVANIDLYYKAMERTGQRSNFETIAWCVMPDHHHLLFAPKSNNPSDIMKIFKHDFGFLYRQRLGVRTGRVWQLRFWDHVIRNQNDMNFHINYIHYNPVRHGLTKKPGDYPHSSFNDNKGDGYYEPGWGEKEMVFDGDFGE
jgi:putative transposase